MSIIDELTSILNRRGLFESLTQEIARANADGTPLSVLYVDVDGFKKVNDDYGHAAGDEVLKRTADFLQAATIAIVAEVPLERLRHAVPAFPTRSEIWLKLLEAYGL